MSALFLPALCIAVILAGLLARTNVYDAFVAAQRGAGDADTDCAVSVCDSFRDGALARNGAADCVDGRTETCVCGAASAGEAASVVLLRPLSGSAALAAVNDVIRQCGVDSRAARLACVISGASETVFFTASLYLGAADVKRARHAVPAALLAYAAGVLAAARLV